MQYSIILFFFWFIFGPVLGNLPHTDKLTTLLESFCLSFPLEFMGQAVFELSILWLQPPSGGIEVHTTTLCFEIV